MTSGSSDASAEQAEEALVALGADYADDLQLDGNCPVQADGYVLGVPFYFRSRGDAWSFDLAYGPEHLYGETPTTGLAEGGFDDSRLVDAWRRPLLAFSGRFGNWPDAGYMPDDYAHAILRRCCALARLAIPPECAACVEGVMRALTGYEQIRKATDGLFIGMSAISRPATP